MTFANRHDLWLGAKFHMLRLVQLSDRAIHRRAKLHLVKNAVELFVATLPGLEHITQSELTVLGYQGTRTYGGVTLRGDLASIYRINLALRSGNRVLLRLKGFLAQSYPMLYNRARAVPWEAVLGKCPSITVHVSSNSSRLRHKKHVQEVVYDAIADRMAHFGLAPELTPEGKLTVMARLRRDRCTLSLDTTGPHLHKRGYREQPGVAPLRETTAAAILLAVDSRSFGVLVDPFCGSGTFLIEAALIAQNRPPGAGRTFAIESSPLHSPGLLRHQLRLLTKDATESSQRIFGSDMSEEAVTQTMVAASRARSGPIFANVADAVNLDFRVLSGESKTQLVVANLPYGKRLGSSTAARNLAVEFGTTLARTANGWSYALVLPQTIPLEHPALVTTRKLSFSNGGIPVVASLGHVRG